MTCHVVWAEQKRENVPHSGYGILYTAGILGRIARMEEEKKLVAVKVGLEDQ